MSIDEDTFSRGRLINLRLSDKFTEEEDIVKIHYMLSLGAMQYKLLQLMQGLIDLEKIKDHDTFTKADLMWALVALAQSYDKPESNEKLNQRAAHIAQTILLAHKIKNESPK